MMLNGGQLGFRVFLIYYHNDTVIIIMIVEVVVMPHLCLVNWSKGPIRVFPLKFQERIRFTK